MVLTYEGRGGKGTAQASNKTEKWRQPTLHNKTMQKYISLATPQVWSKVQIQSGSDRKLAGILFQ